MWVLLRGLTREICRRIVHGVLVFVPGKLEGFARFLGLSGKRDGAKKLLRQRGNRRGVGGHAAGSCFNVGSSRLRPRAGSQKRRKDEQEATRNETSHVE